MNQPSFCVMVKFCEVKFCANFCEVILIMTMAAVIMATVVVKVMMTLMTTVMMTVMLLTKCHGLTISGNDCNMARLLKKLGRRQF